jgi:hypothetical protein
VTALAVHRLFGVRAGAVALLGLGLSLTEPDAPAAAWLVVLLGEALVRALRAGKLHAAVRFVRLGAWLALAAALIPFAIRQVRAGLYPATMAEAAPDRFFAMGARAPAAPGLVAREQALSLEDASEEGLSIDKAAKTKAGASRPAASPPPASSAASRRPYDAYDPGIVVQTGPGLPGWSWGWGEATLAFNGPVARDHELRLWLVPPAVNLLLSLARVALLGGLAFLLLRRPLRLGGGWLGARPLLGPRAWAFCWRSHRARPRPRSRRPSSSRSFASGCSNPPRASPRAPPSRG